MAKLNGVKTIDMVNGEITKVSYEGAEYAKVDNGQPDDIGLVVDGWGDQSIGEFYKIKSVSDECYRMDGYQVTASCYKKRMQPFRKISESKPTLEQRVESLESDVATLKGEKKSEETIEFEGATYRKVDREAREGDVVIFRKNWSVSVDIDEPYKVGHAEYGGGKNGLGVLGKYRVYSAGYGRTRETVDVYEPIEQAKYVPQEGDIVVITANTNSSGNKVGDIGKVTEVVSGKRTFRVQTPQGPKISNWTEPTDVRKATPAEVEQYEQAVHKASFAIGDYVKLVKSYCGLEGSIVKITGIGKYNSPKGVCDFLVEHLPKKDGRFAVKAEQIVKATDAEIAKATAPKLKAGDFVKFEKNGMNITAGKVYEVNVTEDDDEEFYVVDDVGMRDYGVGRNRKYEILSAEEAKWAKIGRRIGELRKGDIVRITDTCGADLTNGELIEVISDSVEMSAHVKGDWAVFSKLVTPVESLFNMHDA